MQDSLAALDAILEARSAAAKAGGGGDAGDARLASAVGGLQRAALAGGGVQRSAPPTIRIVEVAHGERLRQIGVDTNQTSNRELSGGGVQRRPPPSAPSKSRAESDRCLCNPACCFDAVT